MIQIRRRPTRRTNQQGLTLIELLVALGLGFLVVVIATSALLIGQQGYRVVDATTELRDRERFVSDLVARVVIQAGFQDLGTESISLRSAAGLQGEDPEPDLIGWNNAVYKEPDDLVLSTSTKIVNGNRPAACTVADTSCVNGSDVLAIRYQGVSSPTNAAVPDNTIINCAGQGEAGLTAGNLNDRAVSIFSVTRGANGEPALSCSYYNFTSGAWVGPTPLIEGVESFQVLYGTDGVVPATIPSPLASAQDSVVERWLRADQFTVAGNVAATRENWRRVRAVRIGMVLRGSVGSAQQSVARSFYPLGALYESASDPGSNLAAAADGRLRLERTFTVHFRNNLSLK